VRRAALRRRSERSRHALSVAAGLIALGLPRGLAAAAVGVDKTTLTRWGRRARSHQPLVRPRGPSRRALTPTAQERASELVRALAGQVGVESLRRSVGGLSRRMAAAVKRRVCREMERERRRRVLRVSISTPGVLRSLDAMHMDGKASLLVAADGAVPYRTSWAKVPRYDGQAVAALIERDLSRHGAPLVLRMDRARQHQVAAVREVLARHHVLLLQGPPRCPRFYGQLERQNREHRAWLRTTGKSTEASIDSMMEALNQRWRRRKLDWHTAAERWNERPALRVDRMQFEREVKKEATRLRTMAMLKGKPRDLPERLAIEHTLERRGLLRRQKGGWC
jgi:hypothetical protein